MNRTHLFAFRFVVLLFAAATLFSSCQSNTPESVTEGIISALNNNDFKKAKALGTEGSSQMIGLLETLHGMAPDSIKNQKSDRIVSNVKCATKDSTATCTYTVTSKKEGKSEEHMDLVKRKGKWLADLKKDAFKGDGKEGEQPADDTIREDSDSTAPAPVEPATIEKNKKK